ncbi:hypothetical protein BGW36DRAFT_462192 [Talaromyces proteolyticus]|uniref:Uncharacterized protein n=1 Tax=Talaromyces proteolyticus TaxID=1131652 RepID=A0AAD4KQW5_9EURO|nr:uncharacterized protein BGW36DRAFT_462192 [Talaromyces proteolyticus]KAH8696302.1 hypothetical protein BGW36DRAFT_462192 [Talaromyces proteolyticus]
MNDAIGSSFSESPSITDSAACHQSLDPIDLLNRFRDTELTRNISTGDGLITIGHTLVKTADNAVAAKFENEKLQIGKEGARYLSSVMKEVSQVRIWNDLTEEEWKSNRPLYSHKSGMKLELSILAAEQRDAMVAICQKEDPLVVLNETIPMLIKHERCTVDEGLEFPEHFLELPDILEHDLRSEKLEASRDTAQFLTSVLGYLDDNDGEKGGGSFYYNDRHREVSPLYIEPAAQYTPASKSWPHKESPNFLSWDEGIENTPKAQSDPHETRRHDESKYFMSQIPSIPEREIEISEGSDHQPTASPLKETIPIVEANGKRKLPDETCQTDKDAIQDSVGGDANPTGSKTTRPFGFRDKQLQNIITPSMLPSSLGTLSSFMQTRGQNKKRQRPSNESPYFNNPPMSNNVSVQESGEVAKTEEITPESPFPQHASQNDLSKPCFRFPLKESVKPLLLILSTTLLQANRSLVHSLENVSTTQNLRLIFRDYTSRLQTKSTVPDTPGIVEEADIICSPSTGILLTTSQETTQKYLPGHGSPTFDSRLKERIALVAYRYERLYVLVQVPVSVNAITMSSIRELGTFCVSLGRSCTVHTLLVPPDHILEWILAIATKYTIVLPDMLDEKETQESETLWSSYLDDQTQWELFLRHTGLNPFAAQSVLDILRNHQPQSYATDNGDRASDLSSFIEMSPITRRKMFQETVGERVLQRVERGIETDWQVEWAVDLN